MATEKELKKIIQSALQGDQSSYTQILDKYWSEVYHFILKRSGNETDAEDITIEAFSRSFDKLHTYKDEYAFNTWLITIAKNIHLDLIRKRKASSVLELDEEGSSLYLNIPDGSPTIEDELIYEQNLLTLKYYIRQLKPHYQEIIQLRYFQELTYQEIAEKIQEPMNNVKIKVLRARKLLTELIRRKV